MGFNTSHFLSSHHRSVYLGLSVIALALLCTLCGCSAEKTNIVSVTYHNITAHYNAYFYAKRSIEEIENLLWENHENNYDKILRIYPELDSAFAQTYKEQTDNVIKKASIAIDRHKNSKWVDDCYLLVGQARYYDLDFVNAIVTYKSVYTKSKDENARVEALAYLIRTYTDYGEYANARAVFDYLKKAKINKENAKLVHRNMAYFYQMTGDLDNMVKHLVEMAPLLKKNEGKARTNFLIGQIYQSLGFDAEAYNYYRNCIASNPPYELDFVARLNLAQVTGLDKKGDLISVRKTFAKLLKDQKNVEFKDRIYYEMGEFEAKQGNLQQALGDYRKSVSVSTRNNRQKGLSYLRLGQIYFDSLSEYELAKSYYDSTVSTLPKDYDGFESIQTRQQVLAKFVEQVRTINLQDSLLVLADRDSATVKAEFVTMLKEQAEAKAANEEKERQRAARVASSLPRGDTGFDVTSWYFDNPSAVAQGQAEFRRIWGDRPLEDHWRRSTKQSVSGNFGDTTTSTINEGDIVAIPGSAGEADEIDVGAEADRMMAAIPYSQETKEQALAKIETAFYNLGNIYNFDLEEKSNSIEAFETLLRRFPSSSYKPEVLYQLFLLNEGNPDKQSVFKDQLVSGYPNTTYAKLLLNPNYTRESSEAAANLKKAYERAYSYYRTEQYGIALAKVDSALTNFPETSFTPQVELLRILIVGHHVEKEEYESLLQAFITKNPDRPVTSYAQSLLQQSKAFNATAKGAGITYMKGTTADHYFVVMYKNDTAISADLNESINLYNILEYGKGTLRLSNLLFNESQGVILVGNFANAENAMNYFQKIANNDVIDPKWQNSKMRIFVISKENFDILYQTKDLQSYLRFFKETYGDGS